MILAGAALMWLSMVVLLGVAWSADPVTFDAAVREALERGPAAEIADAQRREALADATAGASWSNPTGEVVQLASESELRVTVPVPVSGQPLAAWREAAALRSAAEVRGDAARAASGLEAGRAYLDAQRTEEVAMLAAETLALAERRRAAAKRLLAAQEIGRIDAAAYDGDAAQAISAASVAESSAFRARLILEASLGREPRGDVVVGGWPELSVPIGVDPLALPGVVEAGDRARAAVAARTRARLELVPTPSLVVGWRQSGSDSGVIAGVTIQVPLFSPGVAASRSASASADRAAAEARAATLGASSRWLAGVYEAESAEAAWRAMDAAALRDALAGLALALDAGELSIAEYGARRDAIVSGLQAEIDARYRLAIARLELWQLAGLLPPEVTP